MEQTHAARSCAVCVLWMEYLKLPSDFGDTVTVPESVGARLKNSQGPPPISIHQHSVITNRT